MKNLYITLIALFLVSLSSRAQILGTPIVCTGTTTALSDPGASGWSSSDVSIATVDTFTGLVTGISAGTTTIGVWGPSMYTAFIVVTVNPTPTTTINPNPMCVGDTATLSVSIPMGVWSTTGSAVSATGMGDIIGVSAGTAVISYMLPSTGCVAITIASVNPAPSSIVSTGGMMSVCVGNTTMLTDAPSGGTWSTSPVTGVATIGVGGVATGLTVGTAMITYTLPSSCIATAVLTINPLPTPLTITPNPLCEGSLSALSDGTPFGTWSSANPLVASVSGTSITGNTVGTATITYTIASGCMTSLVATVNSAPAPITGTPGVCIGLTTPLNDMVAGGSWSTSSLNVTVDIATGLVTGVMAGTATVSYTIPSGCSSSIVVTVNAMPAAISGPSNVCEVSSITLTDATPGGVWTTGTTTVLTIASSSGIATGMVPGTSTVSYTLSGGCASTLVVTVDAMPAAPVVSGTSFYCPCITFVPFTVVPSSGILWYTTATGGTGSSTAPVINTCIPGVTTNWASQTAGGCESPRASFTVTVDVIPVITAVSTPNCGGTFSISGSGAGTGGTYMWSPAAGLSCTACASPTASISSTTTYTVTGTNTSGCSGSGNVTVDADRISGYISLTTVPTDTLKVWLIQFNPADSSLIAEDSVFSCMDAGTPYYEFDGKPAGSYMVKAKLLSSVPGTSGYVPTYGLSSSTWDMATTIAHTAGNTDTQPITMIYGTVPAGPGFIGGLISSGAGRGTSGGAPVAGILVYLKDATTGAIVTYTYTDATGAYSFSSIANGAYTIYPVDYHYHTTPWVSVSPTTSLETVTGINFYQGTTSHSIKPVGTTVTPVCCGLTTTGSGMYPNPASGDVTIYWENEQTGNADVIISDVTGREVYRSAFSIDDHSGSSLLNISGINSGVYFLTLRSGKSNYTNKLLIQH